MARPSFHVETNQDLRLSFPMGILNIQPLSAKKKYIYKHTNKTFNVIILTSSYIFHLLVATGAFGMQIVKSGVKELCKVLMF